LKLSPTSIRVGGYVRTHHSIVDDLTTTILNTMAKPANSVKQTVKRDRKVCKELKIRDYTPEFIDPIKPIIIAKTNSNTIKKQIDWTFINCNHTEKQKTPFDHPSSKDQPHRITQRIATPSDLNIFNSFVETTHQPSSIKNDMSKMSAIHYLIDYISGLDNVDQ